MKSLLAILLSLLVVTAQTALMASVHYCNGEPEAVALMGDASCCCDDGEEASGCCSDEEVFIEPGISDVFHKNEGPSFNPVLLFVPIRTSFIRATLSSTALTENSKELHPKPPPLSKLQVFRI